MNIESYKNSSLEELFVFIDIIKIKGHLVLIKIDGERETDEITVVISYPSDLEREPIRYDGNNLRDVLFKALQSYFLVNEI